MRFLDVKTDYAFKMVFGNAKHQDLLLSFLNSILTFQNDEKIEDLTIQDPYNPPLLKGMKDSYVDVKATLSTGEQVMIEMQVINHDGFEKRVLYNACKKYSMQLVTGSQYHLLKPVIAVSVVDFVMFDNNDRLINCFRLLEKEQLTEYSGEIELVFIELPKFQKNFEDLQELQDQWIYFVKHAEEFDLVPDSFNPSVQKALEIVNEAGMTSEELELHHKRKEFVAIQKSSIELGEKKGKQEGREEGREEGRQEEKLDIAQKMLAQGLEMDLIQSITGLSPQQIQNL